MLIFRRVIVLILIKVSPGYLYSQNTIVSGRLFNASNKMPVSYATVEAKGSQRVCDANQNGYFKIAVNKSDTLILSCIGFFTDTIVLSPALMRDSFFLNEKIIELHEVVVKKRNSQTYGIFNQKITRSFIGSSSDARFEIATKIEIPDSIKEYKISKFFLRQKDFNEEHSYRVHIYSVDENGLPGEEFLKRETIVTMADYSLRDGLVTVDISDQEIIINRPNFFVGVQWLNMPSKKNDIKAGKFLADFGVAETDKIKCALTYRRSLSKTGNRWYVEYEKAWVFPATGDKPALGTVPLKDNPINMIAAAEIEILQLP